MHVWKGSLALILGLGCASGGSRGPTFEYQPTSGPARYSVADDNTILVDTPMGLQESGDSTRATVAISIGGAIEGGREVTAMYEALTIWLTGAATGKTEGGSLLDQPMSGTLSPSGRIEFEAEIEPLNGIFDSHAVLADFFVPMPEDGNTDQPWQISRTTTSEGVFDVTSTFEGSGQIIGDTLWNGRPAKVIRIDGDVTQTGSGQPAESPAAIEFRFTGSSTTTYVWDHMAGLMLAAVSSAELQGPLTVVGFDMTMQATAEATGKIELVQ
jgi:hypothetical protein